MILEFVWPFPIVGGEWLVQFTTIGTGDLIISGVDGTTFGDSLPDDLKFLELNNGTHTLSPTIIRDSVIFPDYSSDQQGFANSLVLSSGKHDLEFRFGTDVESAHNLAGTGDVFLSVSKAGFLLRETSPTDASTISSVPIKIGESLIDATAGLATNPLTGELWSIVRDSGVFTGDVDLGLVKIDPFTGQATVISQLDDFYVSLAFDSSGTLYTTTDIDAAFNDPNTLYSLSTTDASSSPLCALLSNDFLLDDKALGFNPNDPNFIYYASGGLFSSAFEKIDITGLPLSPTSTTCPTTTVAIPSDPGVANARAITFSESEGRFLWSQGAHSVDLEPGNLFSVSADGLSAPSLKGLMTHPSKGIAFINVNGFPTAFADLVTTDVDVPITISVLSNDEDPEGDTLAIDGFDDTSTESAVPNVVNNGDGTLTYTPPPGFSGSDSFTYTIEVPSRNSSTVARPFASRAP